VTSDCSSDHAGVLGYGVGCVLNAAHQRDIHDNATKVSSSLTSLAVVPNRSRSCSRVQLQEVRHLIELPIRR
jgi:hypothetical protein